MKPNEHFEFEVNWRGVKCVTRIDARDMEQAIMRLEDVYGGLALGDFVCVRRTYNGVWRVM